MAERSGDTPNIAVFADYENVALGARDAKFKKFNIDLVLERLLERGNVVFPKSVTPERIEENFAIFDFELDDADMERITGLDRGEDGRTGPHPNTFAMIPIER